ncbi:hypothetical protein BAUCODRAFT_30378 [Baudoinia panamericana UAMH 10762]|uniref:Uncharacterized protein n=1 Tax=Baudoinia panamericana (strain UAMH 10762) TaxID=717646 RepID=M2MSV6_BAUPA|nr:uncharacterized protein BAUCODRAFT_30378 [Baudoinia panamericana UAMH 10762]EMC99956.1 hypothetical protein BAUCODRAFT_30378 [Baudoinia panamericana UAMH 10762]
MLNHVNEATASPEWRKDDLTAIFALDCASASPNIMQRMQDRRPAPPHCVPPFIARKRMETL